MLAQKVLGRRRLRIDCRGARLALGHADAAERRVDVEGAGSIELTITRAGSTDGAATAEFTTTDGSVKDTSDYTAALGILRFGPGETTKSIIVLITDDGFAEGDETLEVKLANASGTEIGSPATLTLTIRDNDASPAATNPLNDARFFVRQHYRDFLNREPDEAGLDFWVQQITSCASIPTVPEREACFEERKLNVSTAFFLSIEFKQSGHLVFCFYKASFPESPSRPLGFPRLAEFLRDTQEVGRGVVVGRGDWETVLASNKAAFARRWVDRDELTTSAAHISRPVTVRPPSIASSRLYQSLARSMTNA